MLIETYILANNEERLLPYIMRHYAMFSNVILLESNSTDNTVELAKLYGAEVWSYRMPDEINENWYCTIKNNCWKKSKADWVIVVDADEFVYHPQLKKYLEKTPYTIFKPPFFQMFSADFPKTENQIYKEVFMGKLETIYAKTNIFKPSAITDINYSIGSHGAIPSGDVRMPDTTEIKTLHFRWLGKEFVHQRNVRTNKRRSDLNREMGWGDHTAWSYEKLSEFMDEEMKNLINVLKFKV
jgi:hypothetical protein